MSRQYYENFFREADADGSGYLSVQELIDFLRKKGFRGSDDTIKRMFRRVDTSADDEVSLEEFLTAMGVVPEKDRKSAAMRACFRSFDLNGDGKIDRYELAQVFKEMGKVMPKQDIDRIIQMADKDNSGTLDYEEFIAQVFGK